MRKAVSALSFLLAVGIGVLSYAYVPVPASLEKISADVDNFDGRNVIVTTVLNRDADGFYLGDAWTRLEYPTYISSDETTSEMTDLLPMPTESRRYFRVPVTVVGTIEDGCKSTTCCGGGVLHMSNVTILSVNGPREHYFYPPQRNSAILAF